MCGIHRCNLNEIRTDHNDLIRTVVLDILLQNIREHYKPFRDDLENQRELIKNRSLDPVKRQELVEAREEYDQQVKQTYGTGIAYQIFKEIMQRIVTRQRTNEKSVQDQQEALIKKQKSRQKATENLI